MGNKNCLDSSKQILTLLSFYWGNISLQQWFEYCPGLKKRCCPICKQVCTDANVTRLYFQSVGDTNESILSQKQRDDNLEGSSELRLEVNRLERKVSALTSNMEKQEQALKEVHEQYYACTEQLKVEIRLKRDAQAQKVASQKLLQVKSEELDQTTLAYMKEQGKTMALAKELAAIKLVTDLNLEEEDVTRLAALGNDPGSKDTVDVLRRSLVIRNKSYKELMAKCNVLGRGEAKCAQKLNKAIEKVKKLKLRVQELETALEIRDNGALRALKDHQDCKLNTRLPENLMKGAGDKESAIDDATIRSSYDHYDQKRIEGGNIAGTTISGQKFSPVDSIAYSGNDSIAVQTYDECKREASFDAPKKAETSNEMPLDKDDEVFCYGNKNPVEIPFHIRKETMPCPPSRPGEHCFSRSLLGADRGTNLGKWCSKVQNKTEEIKESPSTILQKRSGGDLIAVGADGRGGRVKVMRSLHRQSAVDTKAAAASSLRKIKHCPKTNGMQNQVHLQIEHFFQRARS